MDWTAGLGNWIAKRPRRGDDADDRAGMGTAFGLDASLVPWDDDEAAAPAAAVAPAPSAWDYRVVRRCGL